MYVQITSHKNFWLYQERLCPLLGLRSRTMSAGEEEKRPTTVSSVAARKRLALFLLCLASFIAVVDTTIVSIALPSMRRELGLSGADAQ
jgi:hypothetical protein